jgi:hypothetical protein
MAKSKTAGSRSEFVAAWNEWARAINKLAYQSDDERTIMDAIKLRDGTLALILTIADEIYPVGDLPGDYPVLTNRMGEGELSPIEWVKENDDPSTD